MNRATAERTLPGYFSEATRSWFASAFAAPTPVQEAAWDLISSGKHSLVVAPTGSGKTLAAFLWSLDRLARRPPQRALKVLYISPLKALAFDIERNLRGPLAGMRRAAARLSLPEPAIQVGVRTGDTPQEERRRLAREAPHVLITTPESLFLLLTSQACSALATVETVIVDEVHAVAGTKRGAHLALSLERLEELTESSFQRIGLSATVRPVEEVSRFLGGERTVEVAAAPPTDLARLLELQVSVPVDDLAVLGDRGDGLAAPADPEERKSVWPHVHEAVLSLIRSHRSTIVFAGSRRLAERLSSRLNELAGEEIARAHHGSISREQRVAVEEALKAGSLKAVVATSSLELGIDMGAVDLVVHVGAPDSVASGLQRVGRAGHHVGEVSRGVFFPRFRGDLLECAVIAERMSAGEIEGLSYPRNPLDVLAQQIVAMVAMEDWFLDDLEKVVGRAASFSELPRGAFEGVVDMLAGRYPSDEFAELRPRLNWDRATGRLSARPGAQRLAVTSGGAIPDRGLYGVFLSSENPTRVGELDEEMVYESRVGEVFVLGASSWLIEDITPDRVIVSPAPGRTGKMPFWHGDAPGRPYELGRAVGAFLRELTSSTTEEALLRLERCGLDERAARNLLQYVGEQRETTGSVPDDRTIVVERFRDEIGDWRICLHSPFGARVHAPWAQAIEARLRSETGLEVRSIYSDDGIVVTIPAADDPGPAGFAAFDADEIEGIVVEQVGSSALFASRFREAAARALLLPRRAPGKRTPLWRQRQRSASLLQVASRYPSFPIVLEAYRECLRDVFDLPALKDLMGAIARREVRIVEVETAFPSPFASSLQFGYVSAFMYEGDAPLAERRAQALSLDRSLLSELLGRDELRDLVDQEALTSLELEIQWLGERKARSADDLHDMLRDLGDLTGEEAARRYDPPSVAAGALAALVSSRRAIELRVAGEPRYIAVEDAARYRDALGAALPVGLPAALLEPVADPLGDLVGRFARTHGPFTAADAAARLGLGVAVVGDVLRRLERCGRVVEGEFRPQGSGPEWIDARILRRLRRRSLAAFRREIEPVPQRALARFLVLWHGIGCAAPAAGSGGAAAGAGADALYEAVERLQGAPLPASQLETLVLPARVPGYSPALLDALCASGEVMWAGAGAAGPDDGWIVLATAELAPALMPGSQELEPAGTHLAVRRALEQRGALFFRALASEVGTLDDSDLLAALWDLVWAGLVTNDTLAPLRAAVSGASGRRSPRTERRSRPRGRLRRPVVPARSGPPAGAGRWALVAPPSVDPTRRLHALASALLERHGVLTRGALSGELVPGGFAGVYPVLKALEESGRARRGYFVEGLGGAQFALPGAVDRMRAAELHSPGGPADGRPMAQVLAAGDPASPFGAALPWPEREADVAHRPGRKAGALVVSVEGEAVLFVEKGGRSILSFTSDAEALGHAAAALVRSVTEGAVGALTVERADGEPVFESPLARALEEAGFRPSSRGLRLRA